MLQGVMAVTVAVMIVPLHTTYPPFVGVAWATEVRAPENPIWVAGELAGSIPARRPETSGKRPSRIKVAPSQSGLSLATERPGCLSVSMRLIGPTTLGSSFGSCRCTTLPQRQVPPARSGGRWQIGHLQKIYNGKKAALKEKHWIPDSDGTYDLERIRQSRPSHIFESIGNARIAFWMIPRTMPVLPKETKLGQRARRMPTGIPGLGTNTRWVFPTPRMRIMASFTGTFPGVGRVLSGQHTVIPPPPPCTHSSVVAKLKKREKVLSRQVNMFMKLFRSDDKFPQMLSQLESHSEIGGGSRSGGSGR
ncbi:hypothetical protein Tco_0248251 [Tanacetum coccineum]